MRNLMAFFPGNFSLQNHPEELQSLQSFNPVLPSCSAPQEFHGVNSLLGKRSMSFSGIDMCEEINGDDELSDDCLQIGEKKKRLNFEQVKTLEKNFELGNKLEPERKIQLAKTLGLQPRQIAIWFQNRRARWKTKQLEKDYGVLKKEFETLKADNDALQAHNKKLQEEILALKGGESQEPINLNKETEASCSNKSENSYDINLEISRTSTAMEEPLSIHPHRPIFQSLRPTNMMQFIHNSSRSDLQFPKVDNGVHEDGFCNLLCNVEEQTTTFWPWTDHNHFH